MAGVGTPDLILPPGASPHGHTLRPSEARAVADADLTVWVGPALTPGSPIPGIARRRDPQLELMEVPDAALLPVRVGAAFELHHHEGEDAAHDHAEEASHGEDERGHAEAEHAEDAHHDHDEHGAVDAHIWLDPASATRIASAVAAMLAEIDPENAAAYQANAEAVTQRNAA